MRHIKIYFASKRHHAKMLKGYDREGFHFNARWLDTANLVSNAAKPAAHWLEENFDDIMACDYVFCYAEKTDPVKGTDEFLKTALVEVGFAMAYGKPVYVIGSHESYTPWRANSRRVHFAPTIEAALMSIKAAHAAKEIRLGHDGKVSK